jgi:calcineurin-like phosphoesterase family protein
MAIFVTSDWHLGEDRFDIMDRPFDDQMSMVETLVKNHNDVVNHDDTVYVLGDVCYQKTPEYLKYAGYFNGNKILVRGNHDRNISDEEFSPYFKKIIPEGEGIELHYEPLDVPLFLTHYPSCGVPDRFNLVGHIHSTWKYQLNMLNVGVDAHHFYPVCLDAFPFHYNAVTKFFDDDVWMAYQPQNEHYRGVRGKPGTYFTKETK